MNNLLKGLVSFLLVAWRTEIVLAKSADGERHLLPSIATAPALAHLSAR